MQAKKAILLITTCILVTQLSVAQFYRIGAYNGQTVNTCRGQFVASDFYVNDFIGNGFPGYFNNENNTVTFCNPSGSKIRANFYWLDIETNFDFLYIYDGPNTASPLIATLTGSTMYPGAFTSSGSCLTFRFTSNGSVRWSGWNALLGCEPVACGDNEIAADDCFSAPTICNLNGYCGSTSGWYTRTHGNIEGSQWGGSNAFSCGSIQNNSWIAFIASANNASFRITPSNCVDPNRGMQAVVLRSTNCVNFSPVSTCFGSEQGIFNLNATGLTPGQKYYIMIDGVDGNDCNYTVQALSGVQNVSINSSVTGGIACEGQNFTLSANVVGIGPFTYAWSPAPISGQGTANAVYQATVPQTYSLTVTGACNSAQTVTYFQNVNPLPSGVSITGANTICTGSGGTTLNANVSNSIPSFVFANNSNFNIPDNTVNGITSPINVSGMPSTQLQSVCINIAHGRVGDLVILLRCPNGTQIDLSRRRGGNGTNFTNTCFSTSGPPITGITAAGAPYTGTYTPEEPLSLLSSCPVNGTWELIVRDRGLGITGRLQSWTLNFANNLSYTWSPATGLSSTAGPSVTANPSSTTTYTVTVSDMLGCSGSATHTLNVGTGVTPTFNPIAPFCSGAVAPPLPVTSNNGITGTWSPATVSNTASGTYTFTPNAGQCATTTTLNVTVNSSIAPTFNPIAPICNGATAPTLPGTSTNSITGTWSPATVSNTASATYTFTPNAGQCATTATLNVTVNPNVTPTFNPIAPICNGATPPTLPGTSTNSIAGTWSPATVSNTASATYTFTPNAGQCATNATLNVTVNPNVTPTFNPITPFCSGTPAPVLPGTSTNSIAGTWSPATVSNTSSGVYNFTPNAGQCATGASLSVTVNSHSSSVVNAQICTGQSYTLPDGSVVSAAGAYPVMLTAANGCDSVVTTNITVNNTLTSTTNASICDGDTYTLPDGSVVTAANSYTSTLTSVNGCDSIITTNLTVNPVYSNSVNASICAGESYTLPDGSVVSANGNYVTTLSSMNGCDSVIITNLTVNPILSSVVNANICDGDSYTLPDGSVVTVGGNYSTTLSSAVTGCDSVVTTNLTVNPVFSTTVDVQICTGQSYTLPDGSVVSAGGSYPVTLTAANGCDSVVTTNITVNNTLTSTTNASICDGDTYTLPDGAVVTAANSYTTTLTSVNGCDSIITTNLTVNPVYSNSVTASICQGQSFTLPDGSVVSANGNYVTTLSSMNGCDSVITTNLTVNPILSSVVNASICAGDSYTLPDGSVVTVGGNYSTTLSSAVTGCDSVVTTNLTVNPVFSTTVDVQICTGQNYTLPDGSVVSAGGSYPVTLTAANGCDSVVTTNITVNNTLTSTTNASICDGDTYTLPDGSVVTAANSYTSTLTSVNGCDSIITTNLTVNPVYSNTVSASICQGQSYTLPDGLAVSANGSYTTTLSSMNGCDSVIITNLTVNPILSSVVNANICDGDSYTLPDGSVVTVGGNYSTTLSSAVTGCDSVVTTNLTVNPVFSTTVDVQICTGQNYTLPDGSVVSAGGSYPVTLTAANGCDSVVTTNIAVNNTLTSTTNASICDGDTYTLPDGAVVTAANSYTTTLTSVNGCDSIITTNLTVNPVYSNSVNASICQGQSYTLPDGSAVSANGSYTTTLSSVNGCDSVITTNLTVNPILSSVVNVSICDGDSYTLPDGSVVTVGGNYSTTLSSAVTGCDSVVTTNLTVNPVFSTTVDVQICTGQNYTLPDGSVVSAGGSYPVTLTAANGCDSVVTTNITVNDILSSQNDATICLGDSYTLPDGSTVTASGLYTTVLTASTGCDSVVTTNLGVINPLNIAVGAQICAGQTYTLPDGSNVSAAGSYSSILAGSNGCDSIVTTNLSVIPLPVPSLGPDQLLCSGDEIVVDAGIAADSYLWNTGETTASIMVTENGNYAVLVTVNGCAGSDEVNIRFDKQPPQPFSLGADLTICEGDRILLSVTSQQGLSYAWQDGSTGNTLSVEAEGEYFVTATNDCGSYTDTILVILEVCESCDVYVPNAFTPNKDGVNDTFLPITTCDDILPYRFTVYNRWYETVFETTQPGEGWDGTFKGKEQPLDVYVYFLSYYDKKLKRSVVQKGLVSLLK